MASMTRTLVQIDEQTYEKVHRLANEHGLRPAQLIRLAVRGLVQGWIAEEALPLVRPGGARRRLTLILPPEDRQALAQFCAERGLYLEGVVERLVTGLVQGRYTIRIPARPSEGRPDAQEETPCPEWDDGQADPSP